MDYTFTMDSRKSIDIESENLSSSDIAISYSEIANKLLRDKFFLTALELHTELVESGREIPRLKEFFSNPGNFETHTSSQNFLSMHRSLSQATLDSLDLTRFSEDGERGVDERVAVLEFELRKAKETINALRAQLTVATECETPTTDNGDGIKSVQCEQIKPHEQRALNFLINEYLLMHGYKLTSITFADENENQDFEDWDDVGLNIPKPAELLQLYRDAIKLRGFQMNERKDSCCQTLSSENVDEMIYKLSLEKKELEKCVLKLEKEKLELEKEASELTLKFERSSNQIEPPVPTHFSMPDTRREVTRESELNDGGVEGERTETTSLHSATPEHFEMIETSAANASQRTSECGSGGGSRIGGNLGERDDTSSLNDTDWTRVNACNDSETDSAGRRNSVERLESTGMESDHTPLEILNSNSNMKRPLPVAFQREVLSRCFVNTSQLNSMPLLQEMLVDGISIERLVHVLAVSLPRIIPNIVLNKREEAIPLIVSAIHLDTEPSERETLLQTLFNLKKRPHDEERRIILIGMVSLARVTAPHVVESELLPQCWEQMSHRYVERRLLVAEACSALAPYVSSALRNSLLLSMLQQLLVEDREEAVRLSCSKSLALVIALIADVDKYSQCEELVLTALQDSSANVVQTAIQTLLPVLAKWAFDLHYLQSHLLTKLMHVIKVHLKEEKNVVESPLTNSLIKPAYDTRTSWIISSYRSLLPYLLMSVATVDTVIGRIDSSLPQAELRSGFAELCRGLTNPAVFYDGEHKVGAVMSAFDVCITDTSWNELNWVTDTMIPAFLDDFELVNISQEEILLSFITLFKSLNNGFGRYFAKEKVKTIFLNRLQKLESSLANIGSEWPSFSIIPVFILAVLAPLPEEESEVGNNLKRFLCALSLSNAPLDSVQFTIRELSKLPSLHEVLMSTLWEGVVHQRHAVRCATANLFSYAVANVGESMTTNRIVPALITLASDPEVSVRTATIPVFGSLIENSTNKEVLDKTYFQLQSFLSDPVARDNHPTLLQLVVTLGRIVTSCDSWFREEVVVPQLAATAAYTMQLTSQTRKSDLAAALVEAFSASVYCSLSKNTITTVLLPGLRYLESVCSQSLVQYHDTVITMIQEAESRSETPSKSLERSSSNMTLSQATSNVGQGVEDMKQKVTKIFQTPLSRPTNLPNLQSIFRKK
ncbi:RAB11-binding protein RELCH homolog [Lycorma delicatula]|uniref:RAB11-binding protein RELCH homolog n=1 Tax=Lycorma delicatula TaxID=130591 RepID=UPI003F517833